MSRPLPLVAVACVLAALVGCDRRPGDPPRPTTSSALDITPATAGLAGVSGPPVVKPPHGPASDPPPQPLPLPAPRPPSGPASGGGAA
jgi:hypothetical protein